MNTVIYITIISCHLILFFLNMKNWRFYIYKEIGHFNISSSAISDHTN